MALAAGGGLESVDEDDKKDPPFVRDLIRSYLEARAGLKELGILRTERSLQSDYAEWLGANRLGLTLSENPVEPGFDATDPEGKTYQIKSRIVEDLSQPTSFDFGAIEAKFDYLVGVFFDPSFEVLQMVCVPYEAVKELGSPTASTFRFRWDKNNAQDPRVMRIDLGSDGAD